VKVTNEVPLEAFKVAIDSNAGGEYGELPTSIDLLIVPVLILRLAITHLLLA
jgi:hypothetical protein